jgi:hypothetical protein
VGVLAGRAGAPVDDLEILDVDIAVRVLVRLEVEVRRVLVVALVHPPAHGDQLLIDDVDLAVAADITLQHAHGEVRIADAVNGDVITQCVRQLRLASNVVQQRRLSVQV